MGLPSRPSGLALAPSSLQLIDQAVFICREKGSQLGQRPPDRAPAGASPHGAGPSPLQPSLDVELRGPAGLSILLILSQVKWCLLIPSASLSLTLTAGTLMSHLR